MHSCELSTYQDLSFTYHLDEVVQSVCYHLSNYQNGLMRSQAQPDEGCLHRSGTVYVWDAFPIHAVLVRARPGQVVTHRVRADGILGSHEHVYVWTVKLVLCKPVCLAIVLYHVRVTPLIGAALGPPRRPGERKVNNPV